MRHWYENLKDRYLTFPKDVQVLNMASDLQKAINLEQVDAETSRNHLYRTLILMGYMIDDPKWRSGLKELLRFREAVCASVAGIPYTDLATLNKTALMLDSGVWKKVKGGLNQ